MAVVTRYAESPRTRTFAAVATGVFWVALALQLCVSIGITTARGESAWRGISIYLAYFTVLSNLIAACVLTAPLLAPRSAAGRFCAQAGTITAAAAYMLLVGLTYYLVLHTAWRPRGWQFVADLLLHAVDPLLMLAYFAVRVRGAAIAYAAVLRWLLWPIVYLAYALARGLSGDFYTYPFIDVGRIGWAAVIVNSIGVGLGFCAIAACLIAVARRSRSRFAG